METVQVESSSEEDDDVYLNSVAKLKGTFTDAVVAIDFINYVAFSPISSMFLTFQIIFLTFILMRSL